MLYFSPIRLPNVNLSLILFCDRRDGRAAGVEYVSDARRQSVNISIATESVRATKLVVLAAGAFGSPAILERLVYISSISSFKFTNLFRRTKIWNWF